MSFSTRKISSISIGVLLVAAVGYSLNQYNRLQTDDEIVIAEWSHVINQYNRRADLVPALVAVVKAYAAHEAGLLNEIADTRAKADSVKLTAEDNRNPQTLEQYQNAQSQLGDKLFRLVMVAESYPELKANESFQDLMVQLEGTENRISYARQRYIGAVASYNLDVRNIPGNLIAIAAGYKIRRTFSVDNKVEIAKAPKADV